MGEVLLENKSSIKNREILGEGEKIFSEKHSEISKVLLPNLVRWLGGVIH